MGTQKGYQTARAWVSDTPIMQRDIEQIIERIQREFPAVAIEQLKVKFAADDDGIWFFQTPSCPFEIQLESSSGQCPFIIETNESPERFNAENVDAALTKLKQWLHFS